MGGWNKENKFYMRIFLKTIFFLLLASLVACSGDGGAKGAPGGKGPGGPGGPGGKGGPGGRPQRSLNVEGYIAELSVMSKEFQTMATLSPLNSVSLSAAASGRLVTLNAKDGASVQKGALIAKIDDSDLKANLKQAEANMALAKQKFDRTQKLHEQGSATAADLESAEASLKSNEASVELIKAQIAKTEVRAPFSGKLGFVNVSVGAWLNAGAAIVELNEVNKLKAKFSLPQRYASVVKVGDKITLKDEERNVEKAGKVTALDATISESSRTRQIMVTVDNAKGELIAGSYTSVKVALESDREPTFTVPAEALILDREGAYVFVCDAGQAKIKHVETGLRTPISVEVLSGLAQGDTVIVSGIVSLRPGIGVKIRELRHTMKYEVDR